MKIVGPRAEMQSAMPVGQKLETRLGRDRKLKTNTEPVRVRWLPFDPRRAARWQSALVQTLERENSTRGGDRKRIVSLGGVEW